MYFSATSAVIKLLLDVYSIDPGPISYSTAHLHVTSGPRLLQVLEVVHGPRVHALLHVAALRCAGAVQAPLLVAGARGAGAGGQ